MRSSPRRQGIKHRLMDYHARRILKVQVEEAREVAQDPWPSMSTWTHSVSSLLIPCGRGWNEVSPGRGGFLPMVGLQLL